jgi:hypothetical protein
MTLANRLRRLEQKSPADSGCTARRDRLGRVVTVECQRQRDESITPLEPEPVPCAACGRVGEFISQYVRPYLEGRTGQQVGDPAPG